jgi:hypothetical protein
MVSRLLGLYQHLETQKAYGLGEMDRFYRATEMGSIRHHCGKEDTVPDLGH